MGINTSEDKQSQYRHNNKAQVSACKRMAGFDKLSRQFVEPFLQHGKQGIKNKGDHGHRYQGKPKRLNLPFVADQHIRDVVGSKVGGENGKNRYGEIENLPVHDASIFSNIIRF